MDVVSKFKQSFWENILKKRNTAQKLDLVQPCETQKISMNNPLFKNIPHVGSFWHLLIVNLYFYIRLFDSWGCHFDILEQSSLQKYTTCWVFLVLYHIMYFCICIFVFVCLIHGNIIFDILEQSSFQK